MNDNIRVLVTGGAGFIGSHLVHRLLDYGYEVVVLDNLSTGRLTNIAAAMLDKDGNTLDVMPPEVIIGNVEDEDDAVAAVNGCRYVFHVAALGSVPRSIEEPLDSHMANATSTLTLLHACKSAGVRRVIFSSSSSVYGDVEGEFKKETLPFNPKTPYAAQKCISEEYMHMYWKMHGLSTVCLRYFNVFGPRQSDQSEYAAVIPKIIRACRDSTYKFLIHGDGEQSRDFTYVDNIVHANLRAMLSGISGESYNIAMGDSHTLNELVSTISAMIGMPLNFDHTSGRLGDIKHSKADIYKAKNQFGYTPPVGFIEGMKATVASYLQ